MSSKFGAAWRTEGVIDDGAYLNLPW
jgi:hypothetical protein